MTHCIVSEWPLSLSQNEGITILVCEYWWRVSFGLAVLSLIGICVSQSG